MPLTPPYTHRPVLAAGHDVSILQNGNTVHKRGVPRQCVNQVAFHSPDLDLTVRVAQLPSNDDTVGGTNLSFEHDAKPMSV